MKKDFDNLKELYNSLKANRQEYIPLWNDIAKFTGIRTNPDYFENASNASTKSHDLDDDVDDPTSAISVTQAADYLKGIIWGTGEEAFILEPTNAVTEKSTPEDVADFYKFASQRVLDQMNHSEAGLVGAMSSFFYDQYSYGTSGIGCFKNKNFFDGKAENVLSFRSYGVDNVAIDEGHAGLVEYIFVVNNWRVNRIVNEFCMNKGKVDDRLLAKMPKKIRDAYEKNDSNQTFNIIQGIYPRDDYNPRLKGKRGTKYRGSWFMEEDNSGIFFEEDYKTIPIAICRQTKIRGEVYGRSAGTILNSSIKSVNYIVGRVIEILEKMSDPSLGIANASLFGDNVLDTSANSLNVFNESLMGTSGKPVFPLYDVGDPTGIINYLVPYLNEKIVAAFKIDLLLDMGSKKEMTASESTQRFIIRGQSLSGLIIQQLTEENTPLIRRAISVMYDARELGIVEADFPLMAETFTERGLLGRIIPQAVLDTIAEGKEWYKIRYSDRVRKLLNTERLEALIQFLNTVMMVAQAQPQILVAVDFYQLLGDIAKELGVDQSLLIGDDEYKAIIAAQVEQQQQAMMLSVAKEGSEVNKNIATAEKDRNVNNR